MPLGLFVVQVDFKVKTHPRVLRPVLLFEDIDLVFEIS